MGTKNPQRPRRAATPRVIRLAAEPAPEITPTVEIVTGQPLPAEKAAAVSAKPKWTKKTDAPAKPKKTSMLDAAAVILGKAKAPVHTRELIDAMLAANL